MQIPVVDLHSIDTCIAMGVEGVGTKKQIQVVKLMLAPVLWIPALRKDQDLERLLFE